MIDAGVCHLIYQIGGMFAFVAGFFIGMGVMAFIMTRNPSR